MDAATILNRFGIPWPDADSDKARQAGDAWAAIANAANDALGKSSTAVSELTANNTGPAMDAFSQYWSMVGGTPDECTTADAKAMLPVLIQAANALASACHDFAQAVDDARNKLEEIAAEIGTAIAAGGIATLVTVGLSDVASGLVSAGLVAAGLDAITVLGVSLDTIVTGMVTGALAGGIDAVLESGLTSSVKADFDDTTPDNDNIYVDLFSGVTLGAITGGAGKVVVGAAQKAAEVALTHLPDSLAAAIPDLPTVINAIPDAAATPAGQTITKLSTEYATKSAVDAPQGKDTDPLGIQEVLGEFLDAKIEAAGEGEGG
jgi:hypothetical protein